MDEIIQEALSKGIELHVAGEFDLASQLYESVLKLQPDHANANHNMGVLKLTTGHDLEALPYLQTALQADTSVAEFWLSYTKALIKLDRRDEASRILDLAKESGLEGEEFVELYQLLGAPNENPSSEQTVVDVPSPPQEILNQLINVYNQGQLTVAVEQAHEIIRQYPKAFMAWNILGAANNGLGRTTEAFEAFKKVTELNPNYADGFNNFGVVLKKHGRLDEAIEAFRNALSIQPDYADAYNNMGNALKEQDKIEEAIKAYRKAISIKSDYAEAHNNLGVGLKQQEKLEEATEAYKKALLVRPDYAEAHNNLGNIFQDQGQLEDAIEAYKKALSIKPDYAEAYNNTGNALKDQGKLEEAIEAYKKALSIKPDYSDAYNNMGNALQDQGKLEEAIKAYKEALSIKPDCELAFNGMGTALQDQGKLEEAIKAYKKALSIKPDYVGTHRNLSILTKYTPYDPQLIAVSQMIKNSELKDNDQCELHFTYAKMMEDLSEFEVAFQHYVAGGTLRKKLLSYEFKNDELTFKKIKATDPDIKPLKIYPLPLFLF